MKKIRSFIIAATLLFCSSLTPTAGAAGVLDPACNQTGGAGQNSAVCKDNTSENKNNNPLTGNDGVIIKVANIVTVIAGVAAVIIIILAGLRYVTSGGSSEDVSGAKRTIVYVVVGLVIIALSRVLVGFAVSTT